MRKDVILGLSIGGILLAIVIVVLTVSPNHKNKQQVRLDPGDGTQAPQAEAGGNYVPDAAAPDQQPQQPVTPKPEDHPATPAPRDATPPPAANHPAGNAVADGRNDPIWGSRLYGTPMMTQTPDPVGSGGTAEQGGAGDQGAAPRGHVVVAMLDKPHVPIGQVTTNQPTGQTANVTGAPTSGSGHRTHTVQKGETFSSIAAAAYGNPNLYPHIVRANPSIDPAKLKPNMIIILPDVAEVKPPEKPVADAPSDTKAGVIAVVNPKVPPAQIDEKTQYRVQSGDSLHKIAIKLYGKISMVDQIYDLNKDAIGLDRAKLKLNAVLKLPAPPVTTTH